MGVLSLRRQILMAQPHKETVVGDGIATFDTDFKAPMKVVIPFEPVQEGTGDPSPDNVRPISGWTGASIDQRGKNMFDLPDYPVVHPSSQQKATFEQIAGSVVFNQTGTVNVGEKSIVIGKIPSTHYYTIYCYATKDNTFYLPSGTYTMRYDVDNITNVRQDSASVDVILTSGYGRIGAIQKSVYATSINGTHEITFTVTDRHICCLCVHMWTTTDVEIASCTISNIRLVHGTTAGEYEPYKATTLPITFIDPDSGDPLTIYGGTVTLNEDGSADVVSNQMSVTGRDYSIRTRESTYIQVRIMYPYKRDWNSGIANKSTHATSSSDRNTFHHMGMSGGVNYLYLPPDYTDEQIAEFMETYQTVYTRSSALSYHFPNIGQLKAFLGTNNIWHDMNGDITVEYWKKQ